MIVRKPYAFLIKNFKKIHIFLFVLCAYIYYKNMQTSSFVNEFLKLGTYDSYNEPITKYVSGLVIFLLIIVIATSIALVFLLKHKKKPWKLYLLPVIEYSAMLILFMVIKGYFQSYDGSTETTAARAMRDIIFILSIFEYPVFLLWFLRIFGIDLHKFNFKMDEEYLELASEDREELEINVDIDKESFKRLWRRLLRNLNYVYQEHKLIINCIATIILIIVIKNTYTYIFVTHKSYKQGQTLEANGYTISINDSYYTDKDYHGEIISKESNFVILDLTVKNNWEPREVNFNQFHIMNGISNYMTTYKVYGTEFQDLGTTYENKELKRNESLNFIIVFKVDKKLDKNRFVLYYQELGGNDAYLRKIKLNMNDVSKIVEEKERKLTESISFEVMKKKEKITLEELEILDEINYTYHICTTERCDTSTKNYKAKEGNQLLKISFSSNTYEGKDMIDFSTKYGKINYKDSKGRVQEINIKNPIGKNYYGKYLYIEVPKEVVAAEEIKLVYTVRNYRYQYQLK